MKMLLGPLQWYFKKVPWSDINSTGKFLSPRRLDPIFTWLTAFNCNKIYTIGKPNIFSICQASNIKSDKA